MKTPEEIKNGLLHCQRVGGCEGCPYGDGEDASECLDGHLEKDALAYIQQLESKLAQAERERDAMMHDLKLADKVDCVCCKHSQQPVENCGCECGKCEEPCECYRCRDNSLWEWRGVCPENTKEASNEHP